MRSIKYEPQAWQEFTDWQTTDAKTWKRIVTLLTETSRTPFEGTGKPELLKHDYKGYWSRRITHEHRLVYKVTEDAIIVATCRNHYNS
jgi:toxin YoeB